MRKIKFLDWAIEIEDGLKSYNNLSSRNNASKIEYKHLLLTTNS